jgi:hypothetical protein
MSIRLYMLEVEHVELFKHFQVFDLLEVEPLEVDGLETDEHIDPRWRLPYCSSSDTFSLMRSSREVSAMSCMVMCCWRSCRSLRNFLVSGTDSSYINQI